MELSIEDVDMMNQVCKGLSWIWRRDQNVNWDSFRAVQGRISVFLSKQQLVVYSVETKEGIASSQQC